MRTKKLSSEEIDELFKKEIREWVREYPELYYKFKAHLKKEKLLFVAHSKLRDDYCALKEPEKVQAEKERMRQAYARAAAQKTRQELDEYNAKSRPNAVQCPYCKSWQTEKIGTGERVVSIAVAGPASGKIGKQWKCLKCGSNF